MRLHGLFTSHRLFPFFLRPLLSVLLDQVPDNGLNGAIPFLPPKLHGFLPSGKKPLLGKLNGRLPIIRLTSGFSQGVYQFGHIDIIA
jgi:hypothetical protein